MFDVRIWDRDMLFMLHFGLYKCDGFAGFFIVVKSIRISKNWLDIAY